MNLPLRAALGSVLVTFPGCPDEYKARVCNVSKSNDSRTRYAFQAISGADAALNLAGTLFIPANTTITGPTSGSGATLTNLVTVSGAQTYLILNVHNVTAAINNLNLTDASGGNGGAITNSGTLTVTGCTFVGNHATYGGGIYSSSILTVNASMFTGNTAPSGDGGGAIFNHGTSVTVTGSTFTSNTAGAAGGAIWNYTGSMTLMNGTFFGNSTTDSGSIGGAIASYAPISVTNSTISGNTAPFGAGSSLCKRP